MYLSVAVFPVNFINHKQVSNNTHRSYDTGNLSRACIVYYLPSELGLRPPSN